MKRKEIYDLIDGERDYQDERWGDHDHYKFHEPEAWIVYVEHYLGLAKKALSIEEVHAAYPAAMDNIRKVAALCVACMENYDTPRRGKQ